MELTPSGGKAAESFEYDGAGLRIRRTVGPETTHFVYDANGELMAEYPTGASVAFVAGNPRYLITDHLGSLRVVTDHQGTVLARQDYLPFGANNTRSTDGYQAATDVRQRFAGSERDLVGAESDSYNDFLQARYLAGTLGRFYTPDEVGADQDVGDPGSWNLYVYARNTPLVLVDPSGNESSSPPPPGLNWIDEQALRRLRDGLYDATGMAVDVLRDWWSKPRDPSCMAQARATFATVGATAGATSFGSAGAAGGGFLGTLALPGGGTVAGAVGGGSGGSALGGMMGTVGGTAFGAGVGMFTCSVGNGSPGGGGGPDPSGGGGADIPWSSAQVRRAANEIQRGATEIKVANKGQAEEIFLRLFQGAGFKNTTGASGSGAKQLMSTGSKNGTYHWDTPAGHGPNNPHGKGPHLQIHTFNGDVIRIFY